MQLVTFELIPTHVAPEPASEAGAATRFTDDALGFSNLELLRPGMWRLGAIVPTGSDVGSIIDLNRALAVKLAGEDVGAPEAEADSLLPSNMLALLSAGPSAMAMARDAFDWAIRSLRTFDGPDLERGRVLIRRRRVRLHAPVPRPGKLLGVARNYAAHAAERSADVPVEPVLFVKASSSVIGSAHDIVIPAASQAVDYEGELAVVIGRAARSVTRERALDHVAGYTIANDVTARDFQNTRGQRFFGKSGDTFCPMGPCLVTADEIDDPQKLRLETRVSGETRQSAMTSEMIFPIAEVIAFASQLMTLQPGDVILTGTPAGVGAALDPPRHLHDGDIVEIEIEGIGCLRNHVRAETPGRDGH
jgi:acylpyruvate hydrolase